jgi:hypothetical protein
MDDLTVAPIVTTVDECVKLFVQSPTDPWTFRFEIHGRSYIRTVPFHNILELIAQFLPSAMKGVD